MIILLVLGFFLTLSFYVGDALRSALFLRESFGRVYEKEKHYRALSSALPRVLELLRREDASYDALTDPWAKPYALETPVGEVSVVILDEDRFLNPNYITKIRSLRKSFEKLFRFLEIDLTLLELILVWTGQEEGSFTGRFPPKRAPLDSVYEIELFWDKKEDLYGKRSGQEEKPGLFELITVFSDGRVNVNTAPIYVLWALDEEIDWELARRIAKTRSEKPFLRVRDLLLVEGMTMDIAYRLESKAKTSSRFFRVEMSVKGERTSTRLVVVYDRSENKIVYREVR
ncbi:MAG: general secretion pathway protein GspK [Aquificae bacterium]|nr:general secretion pathway protein GspK [Aquificota bacterium]